MPPSLQDAFEPHPDVVFRELEGESVLLNLQTGTYFGLDATGTRMWQLIAEHGTLGAVVSALAREFDASDDELARDLVELVSHLERTGLLRRQGAA